MNKFASKKINVKKILFPIIVIVAIVAIFILGKNYNLLDIYKDVEKLQEYILSFGRKAPLVFAIIQFMQVVISPIPGNITTVVGGAVFGFWQSFLISSISVILGSIAAFGLARAFGRPFVDFVIGKERVAKYFDTITKNKKILFVLIILLPFFPDDIICFIAGISGMTWGFFILCMLAARPPGLLISALIGSAGLSFPIWAWLLMFLLIVLIIFVYKKVLKIIEKRN